METATVFSVRVAVETEGVAYIFTGDTEQEAMRALDEWEDSGAESWSSVEMLNEQDYQDLAGDPGDVSGLADPLDGFAASDMVYPHLNGLVPVPSGGPLEDESYVKVLFTQMDADSTRTGQNQLLEQIAACTDAQERIQLNSRLLAGQAVYFYRDVMEVSMPLPRPERSSSEYKELYNPLAHAREELAQWMGYAAFETVAMGAMSDFVTDKVREVARRVEELAQSYGHGIFGPLLPNGAYVWVTAAQRRAVNSLDVPLLCALGVEAALDLGGQVPKVVLYGDLEPAQRFGYTLSKGAGGVVFATESPDPKAAYKVLSKNGTNP